jgi:hypothetical protein
MANRLETKIRITASTKLSGKYNLVQFKKEKEKAILHKQVCEQIVAFADTHKEIPFYFILSVGVSKGAYKESEFNKGYKSFNAKKVESVYQFGQAYLAYNEQYNKKMTDVTIRLIMKYYEKKSQDYSQFLTDLNNSKVLGKLCGAREMDYNKLCENLSITQTTLKEVA